jgi:hypothetical protein
MWFSCNRIILKILPSSIAVTSGIIRKSGDHGLFEQRRDRLALTGCTL